MNNKGSQIRRAPLLYRVLLWLLSPIIIAHLIWKALRGGGYSYFKQRLGFIAPSSASLWIHCASVGEVQTVLPLLDAVLAKERGTILLTTNTPTGKALLMSRNLPEVEHRYLPIDFENVVKRFLNRSQAKTLWIMETEIWPSLYATCHSEQRDLTIINARLSEKSRDPSLEFLKKLYQHALLSTNVLARTEDDAQAFIRLGASPERVKFCGNLKFTSREAASGSNKQSPETSALIARQYCLAASTHADEEISIARAWLQTDDNTLLVIAPRHPERGKRLQAELKRLLPEQSNIALRSQGMQPQAGDRLYLADTIGELQAWYNHAEGIFVGGSLINRGGQNMLEAVRSGRPVVVGAHTRNFTDIMETLRNTQTIQETDSAIEVATFLHQARCSEPSLLEMAKRASKLAETFDSKRILASYLEELHR